MPVPPRSLGAVPVSRCTFDLATYDTGDTFDQTAAKGFVQLHGLSTQISNQRDRDGGFPTSAQK